MTNVIDELTTEIALVSNKKWAGFFAKQLTNLVMVGYLDIYQDGDIVRRDGRRYRVIKSFSQCGEVECLETGAFIKRFYWAEGNDLAEIESRSCGSADRSLFSNPFAIRSYLITKCHNTSRRTVNRAIKQGLIWLRYYFDYRNEEYKKNFIIERGGKTYRVIENHGHTGTVYSYDDNKTYTKFRWREGVVVPDVIGVDRAAVTVH